MRRSCWNRDCVQKADAFSAGFIEKLAPTAACCAQGATVIHLRHRGRTEEDHLKLKGPHRPFQRQPCALIRCEAIAVKLHMPRLIPQQKVAHFQPMLPETRGWVGGPAPWAGEIAVLVTTLDASAYPAEALARLYRKVESALHERENVGRIIHSAGFDRTQAVAEIQTLSDEPGRQFVGPTFRRSAASPACSRRPIGSNRDARASPRRAHPPRTSRPRASAACSRDSLR